MLPDNILNTKYLNKHLIEENYNHLFDDDIIEYPGEDEEEDVEYGSNECYEN